jgi:hypothetical protein
MKFRSHLATYALASVAALAAQAVSAGDAKEPVVLEGRALRGDANAIKPKAFVQTDIPVSYEMRGTLRPDGTVALQCEEAGHGVHEAHDHRDGREEIR